METRLMKGRLFWQIILALCLVVSTMWTVAVPIAAAVPGINSVTPSSGPTSGGTYVIIAGPGLGGGLGTCTFNGLSLIGLHQGTGTDGKATYEGTTPASTAGPATIVITNSGGTVTDTTHFTYVASTPPTVTGVSPNSGPTNGGISVTITGTYLSGATAVKFGTDNATNYTVNSATQITATAPAHAAGTLDITVTTTAGTSTISSADQFTYIVPLPPTVGGVSPNSGSTLGGTSVTITGTNFTWVSAVKFDAVNATGYTVNSTTQITATTPAGAGTVHVTVTTAGGTSTTSSADQFTYVVPPAPVVSGISPATGAVNGGTMVTISGTSFTGATAVSFGSTPAFSKTVNSDTQITAISPAGTGTVHVTVTAPGGTSATTSADQFTYTFSTRYAYGWGNNSYGQGNGTSSDSSTPLPISCFSSVNSLSGGGLHSLGLKSDGTVWTWGYNFDGELGNGTTTNSLTPVQVSGLSGITAIAGGEIFSLALKSDGTVMAWGFGGEGEMGNGTTTSSSTPVQVSSLSGVTAIAAGEGHALALKSDGTVKSWGDNWAGQLGDVTTTNRSSPVTVSGLTGVTAVASGWYHGLALKSDGTVWAWGANNAGQLGNGSTLYYSSAPVQVSGLTGVTAIAGGAMYSLALKSDGTVWAWGANNYGQLGNGTTTNSSAPVQVSGLTGVAAIAAGSGHGLALKSNDTVWCWGYGGNGQLGNGASTNSSTPVQVSGINKVFSISAGGFHSLALTRPAPKVSSISPGSGPSSGGTMVTVTGTGFFGGGDSSAVSAVKFGSTAASSSTVISDISLTAISPAGSGLVDVTVTTSGGTSVTSSTDQFTYNATLYTITFDSNGGSPTPDPITQAAGTAVTAPEDPTKEGYTFAGWLPTVPAIMPESDMNCVAQWTLTTADVNITVTLQGTGRSTAGFIVPLTVNFLAPTDNSTLYTFTENTTRVGTTYNAITTVSGIIPGTYNISAGTAHSLTNFKQGAVITVPSTDIDMGILLEGDADGSNVVNLSDFSILAKTYGKSTGDSGFDARADFDCSGTINLSDFSLLAANYARSGPVMVP